jgi:hypothetical protein
VTVKPGSTVPGRIGEASRHQEIYLGALTNPDARLVAALLESSGPHCVLQRRLGAERWNEGNVRVLRERRDS